MRRVWMLVLAISMALAVMPAATASDGDCQDTGTGLTAKVVNEDVVGETIDVGDCDVGAFFNTNGEVTDSTFVQPDANPAPDVQHGVLVDDADVDVTESEFSVIDSYNEEFIQIGYRDGASGEASDNELSGFKRAGILADGDGTDVTIHGNRVEGVGPKDTGWAENGIQVSRGATASVTDNVSRDHWWDTRDSCSSGIIVFKSDNVTVTGNDVRGNDCGTVLWGDGSEARGNHLEVYHDKAETLGFYGVLIVGDGNAVEDNNIRSHPDRSADVGVGIFGEDNIVDGNFIHGFTEAIVGDEDGENVTTPAGSLPEE